MYNIQDWQEVILQKKKKVSLAVHQTQHLGSQGSHSLVSLYWLLDKFNSTIYSSLLAITKKKAKQTPKRNL